jgi:hypothetical protein
MVGTRTTLNSATQDAYFAWSGRNANQRTAPFCGAVICGTSEASVAIEHNVINHCQRTTQAELMRWSEVEP